MLFHAADIIYLFHAAASFAYAASMPFLSPLMPILAASFRFAADIFADAFRHALCLFTPDAFYYCRDAGC